MSKKNTNDTSSYSFGGKLRAFRKRGRHEQKSISGGVFAELLSYKLNHHFRQQDVSEWENDKSAIPDPDIFSAILELLSFHDAFKSWDEVCDLVNDYHKAAKFIHPTHIHLQFSQADFDRWRMIKTNLFAHLPRHIRNQLHLVIGIDALAESTKKDLLVPVYALSIEGHGGIGKTSLAVLVAIKLADMGIFEGVYFVGVRQGFLDKDGEHRLVEDQIERADEALLQLATQMGLVMATSLTKDEKLGLIAEYYQYKRVLVILDNLETDEDVSEFTKIINTLAQINSPSRIIITSRKSLEKINPRIAQIHPQELNPHDVRLALNGYGCHITLEQSQTLHSKIGGNPLAILLFSPLIKNFGIDELLQQLEQTKSQWQPDDEDFIRHQRLFNYLYERILSLLDVQIRFIFYQLGMAFEMDFGATLDEIKAVFEEDYSQAQLKKALNTLQDVYLLRFDQFKHEYTMHRITSHYIRKEFLTPL